MNKNRSLWILALLSTALCLGLPGAARASDSPNARLLGDLAAVGKFCGSLRPGLQASSEKFQNQLRQKLAPGAASLAEFRAGFDQMSATLAKLDRKQGLTLCSFSAGIDHGNNGIRR